MGNVCSMVCFDLVRGDLFLCSSGRMLSFCVSVCECVCVFSPLMGRARLCELVYFGVCVWFLSGDDSFCIFVLLEFGWGVLLWMHWQLGDTKSVYRCRLLWKLSVINTPGVRSSLAVWDSGLSTPTSVVQAWSLCSQARSPPTSQLLVSLL